MAWSSTFYACQLTAKHSSGDARQNLVWTLHYEIASVPVGTGMAEVEGHLSTYLLGGLDGYLSAEYNSAHVWAKWYHMADAKPRVPVREQDIHTLVAGATRQPAEIAMVLSFRANYESGVKNSSKRNRLYWGPLAQAANDNTTGRPDGTFRATCASTIGNLIAASDNSSNYKWMAWSPTLENAWVVTEGWADNAWDVQRRRGLDPTARTTA